MRLSHDRRTNRGEALEASADIEAVYPYLESGAGELFQAKKDGVIVSSVLVLLSPLSGYSHSAGTSPEGMKVGASQFLNYKICEDLRNSGLRAYNLGGAPSATTLEEFKMGFSPEIIQLTEATSYLGPVWRKKLTTAISTARSNPRAFVQLLTGSSRRVLVYALDTNAPMDQNSLDDVRFERLSEQDLTEMAEVPDFPSFRQDQLDRLKVFGQSYAYGVYVGSDLAHVSWLLPPEALLREPPPLILRLKENEAEITGCETVPQFRRRGLYGFAIHRIFDVARTKGIRRIYMKTQESNVASQSGILKAGLKPIGKVTLFAPPAMPSRLWVFRGLRRG